MLEDIFYRWQQAAGSPMLSHPNWLIPIATAQRRRRPERRGEDFAAARVDRRPWTGEWKWLGSRTRTMSEAGFIQEMSPSLSA